MPTSRRPRYPLPLRIPPGQQRFRSIWGTAHAPKGRHFSERSPPEIKRLFQPANGHSEEHVEHPIFRALTVIGSPPNLAGEKTSLFHQKALAGGGSLLACFPPHRARF